MIEDEEQPEQKVSLKELLKQPTVKPDIPKARRGFPVGVGHSGMSMGGKSGRQRSYDREDPDDDVPSGVTVGARQTFTTKPR